MQQTLTHLDLLLMHLVGKKIHLRSELKVATTELQRVLETLGKKVSESKVTVKAEMEQPLWTAFGINDKK